MIQAFRKNIDICPSFIFQSLFKCSSSKYLFNKCFIDQMINNPIIFSLRRVFRNNSLPVESLFNTVFRKCLFDFFLQNFMNKEMRIFFILFDFNVTFSTSLDLAILDQILKGHHSASFFPLNNIQFYSFKYESFSSSQPSVRRNSLYFQLH
jgi:hypothetical protein